MKPGQDTIDLWRIAWREFPPDLPLRERLSADERERADRLKIEDDRRRYTVGRALLRNLAGRYLGLGPEEIGIEAGDSGKPFLRGHAGRLSFNVSHSGDWVLIAFAGGTEIGVDVQAMDKSPRFRADQVARHAFHPLEREAVESCPEGVRRDLFYSIWTCKEAVIKAAGVGLHGATGAFTVFPLPETEKWAITEGPEAGPYIYQQLRIDEKHAGALAVRGDNITFNINHLTFAVTDIMSDRKENPFRSISF